MFTDFTVAGFSAELDAIEKIAKNKATVSHGAATGIAALGVAGGAAGGALMGHKRGEREGIAEGRQAGFKQGVQQGYAAGAKRGYMAGAQRGFTAGQVATIKRLKAMQAASRGKAAKADKEKKSGVEKTAVVGWMLDAGNFGIPSAVGYAVGRSDKPSGMTSAEETVRRRYNFGVGALVPGYTGYHHGRKSRAREVLDNYRRKKDKKGRKSKK